MDALLLLWLEIPKKNNNKNHPGIKLIEPVDVALRIMNSELPTSTVVPQRILDRKVTAIPRCWVWVFETGPEQEPSPRNSARC